MPAAFIIAAALIGYLLGSVSFAVIVARRHGVDILKAGSGNPGATNVKRVIGKGPGNLVFALDFFKGALSAGWPAAASMLRMLPADAPVLWMGIAGSVGAVLGHSFSIFLRFRGGKGVSTTIGGLTVLMPLVMLGGVAVWLAVFSTTRYVAVASIVMGLALAPLAWLLNRVGLHQPEEYIGLSLVVGFVILIRHRTNLVRLYQGTEHKFEKKKKETTENAEDAKKKI
jgi:glycerol-3-phosphate acyltransferase PlsY